MISVIVAFPKQEIAKNIRTMLVRSGVEVHAVCTTGAQVMSALDQLDSGLIVCAYQFVDMMYDEIREYIPETFDMLLVAPKSQRGLIEEDEQIVCMAMPFKAYELLETVEMMLDHVWKRVKRLKSQPKKRTEEEKTVIELAKKKLMKEQQMSEEEAHRYLQKNSMDNGMNLVQMAQAMLDLY